VGRSLVIDAGLDKLQEYLLAMSPGDEVSAASASQISGLDEQRCEAVLSALMNAGLLMRLQQDAYVRCSLQMTEETAAQSGLSH